ncbi:MAG: YraN family protein [Chloroflexi bacterium]|nr:YraN family protein [Chloroflexota bacterium]
MGDPRRLARQGEAWAARYLQARGYAILGRNVRTPYGEIDIVARDGDQVVFVEVKTRSTRGFGWPEDAVTARKLAHMHAAAEHYLAEHDPEARWPWRLDVLALYWPDPAAPPQVRHWTDVRPE